MALAKTSTTANGRWVQGVNVNPGNYAILYEKTGEFGPDVDFVTVVAPPPTASVKTATPAKSTPTWPTKKKTTSGPYKAKSGEKAAVARQNKTSPAENLNKQIAPKG